MTPITTLNGLAAPIEGRNVDTDQIIPARFLKKTRADGYGDFLFYDLRFDSEQRPRADFVLNQNIFKHASILVCDENFGCGSSREAAVYAVADFGIKAILAPSFGDIFYNNCLKNGVLPIVLPAEILQTLRRELTHAASTDAPEKAFNVAIDLKQRTVQWPALTAPLEFAIDPFWQECLLKGVDEMSLTLGYSEQISHFEQQLTIDQPWLRP
jgi:3-isopropylmalate/(R)-2-methylmalate dehydratase small subunit